MFGKIFRVWSEWRERRRRRKVWNELKAEHGENALDEFYKRELGA